MPKWLEIYLWCAGISALFLVIICIGNHRRYMRAERRKRKPLQMVTILFLVACSLLASGCSKSTYTLLPEGIPVKQEGDRILTVFPEMNGKTAKYQSAWFYLPGHGLVNPEDYQVRVVLERKSSNP